MKLVATFLVFLPLGQHAVGQTHTYTTTQAPKTLATADLPPKVKDQVAHVYSTWFQSPSDPPHLIPKQEALSFNISFPDVAKNNRQVILLESNGNYAGATGNGEMWFFLRSGDNVRLILHTSGFLFDDLPKDPPYHDGFQDIVVGWNMSSSQGGIQVFRFNGSRYVSDHCADYTMDEDETFHFTRRPCQTATK